MWNFTSIDEIDINIGINKTEPGVENNQDIKCWAGKVDPPVLLMGPRER